MDEVRLLDIEKQAEGRQSALDLLEAFFYPFGVLCWLLRCAIEKSVVDEEQRPDIGRREGKGYCNLEARRQINGGEDRGNAVALRRSYVKIEVC